MSDGRACLEPVPDTMHELRDLLPFFDRKEWTDVPEEDNLRRAAFATVALITFHGKAFGGDEGIETVLADLLTDLHHLADAVDIDWDDLLAHAENHYVDEALS